MSLKRNLQFLAAGLVLAAGAFPIQSAEAAGRRISAGLQRSPVVTAPRRLAGPAPRATRSVRSAMRPRAINPQIAASRSAGGGTRVASFVQRAAARRVSAGRLAIAPLNGRPATFVNGYQEYSILGFRSSDFFERGQGIRSQ